MSCSDMGNAMWPQAGMRGWAPYTSEMGADKAVILNGGSACSASDAGRQISHYGSCGVWQLLLGHVYAKHAGTHAGCTVPYTVDFVEKQEVVVTSKPTSIF
jgi:hypothetical protein